MQKINEINEKWIKASIVGTIWAASEIVLGSFLHNLKIPFSGNVLTAIGIIILISVSYIWTEKGIFWRAGIICALMKTMSPSAVIFGPMIAIICEAVLLEISVRIFGKTIVAYILGGMLAMSWNLFHKIANYIIFYGFNIVDLYADLLKFAQKQLNIQFDIVWLPILALLIIYCVLGFIAAIIGIRVGRKILKQPLEYKAENVTNRNFEPLNRRNFDFSYSMIWLFTDILLIIAALTLLNYTPFIYWSLFIAGVVTIWAFRYKRALRQLSKPKLWIFFVIITMITAFVFTKVQSRDNSLMQGLLIGLQMNFRAVIIIVGFSVLGTELYNPRIREFFLKTSFKQLPLALELSLESLPSMITNIPDFKTIVKNPISVIYQVISQVDFRLAEIKNKIQFNQKIFIITGAIGQGKTAMVQKVIDVFKEKGIAVGGIYSPRIIENSTTVGYNIIDIANCDNEEFMRLNANESVMEIGRYKILLKGLQKGSDTLKSANNKNNKIVIIDEVGNLECENHGWAASIQDLIDRPNTHLLLVVRDSIAEKVIQKWNFKQPFMFNISKYDHLEISNLIIEQLT
ncbi:MAG: hypothetical protein HXX16_05355 [Bacteroidales bacterium]|nr:hypothetical protein [Bacteroidales bacterium]